MKTTNNTAERHLIHHHPSSTWSDPPATWGSSPKSLLLPKMWPSLSGPSGEENVCVPRRHEVQRKMDSDLQEQNWYWKFIDNIDNIFLESTSIWLSNATSLHAEKIKGRLQCSTVSFQTPTNRLQLAKQISTKHHIITSDLWKPPGAHCTRFPPQNGQSLNHLGKWIDVYSAHRVPLCGVMDAIMKRKHGKRKNCKGKTPNCWNIFGWLQYLTSFGGGGFFWELMVRKVIVACNADYTLLPWIKYLGWCPAELHFSNLFETGNPVKDCI